MLESRVLHAYSRPTVGLRRGGGKITCNIMDVLIKNVKGTTFEDQFFIWIDAYKRLKDVPKCCPACHECRDDLVGAHVYKLGDYTRQYIVPLCPACNNHRNEKIMTVNEKYLLPKGRVAVEWLNILKEFIASFPVE